jgi:surfeit locus 1 family protein
MLRRLLFPLALGLVGCAILIGLGTWQLGRLAWKQGILSEIEARIAAAPGPLPAQGAATPYMPVTVTGDLGGDRLRVLVSRKQIGPGYRIITALETEDGRRVLLDLGFVRDGAPLPQATGRVTVTGNIHTPDEIDSYTPAPDLPRNMWFARDVAQMSVALGTEETLIVARSPVVPGIEPMPVDTAGIPNDHLNYAITWFLLAAVWAGMTGLLIWRNARPKG